MKVNSMDKLEELRLQINDIDKSLAELFEKRMKLAKEIGEYKKENNLPILDEKREEEVILRNLSYIKTNELKEYYEIFIKEVMSLSKGYQKK